MTTASNRQNRNSSSVALEEMTVAELKELANDSGLSGVSTLRKSELIEKISRTNGRGSANQYQDETLDVAEAGAFWLAVKWKLTEKTLKRAHAALGKDWHSAQRFLRLYQVDWDDAGPRARTHRKDIPIPEEASNWFVQIDGASRGWKVELGYLATNGNFFSLSHSADIEVNPSPKHQFSMGQDRTDRVSIKNFAQPGELFLKVEGDLAIHGNTQVGSSVSIDEESVETDSKTGRFHWNSPLANGRVIIPVTTETDTQRIRAVISLESSIRYMETERLGTT